MDLGELWAIFGPGVSGAVFGAGWWFWIDAVVCSSVSVSFVHYLPGIFASIAALMFNCVRKEDIDYSPYEEGEWSGPVDTRFACEIWSFGVDWNCRCLTVCVRLNQRADILDFSLRINEDRCLASGVWTLELGTTSEAVICVCIICA
ncbi:Uncharacterized protein family UPF0220 - like 1 [Theobroma cacao]|nr:Uncharacterized protein family UPF0220 - like 1 [Theobroma cacao]